MGSGGNMLNKRLMITSLGGNYRPLLKFKVKKNQFLAHFPIEF